MILCHTYLFMGLSSLSKYLSEIISEIYYTVKIFQFAGICKIEIRPDQKLIEFTVATIIVS